MKGKEGRERRRRDQRRRKERRTAVRTCCSFGKLVRNKLSQLENALTKSFASVPFFSTSS